MSIKVFLQVIVLIFAISAQAEKNLNKRSYDFIIVRHAFAPGTGDPENFKIEDCKTQRNLSDQGIRQAKKLADHLPEKIIVYSSQWCRCLDTAKNLNRGPVKQQPLLNSFFQNRSLETKQNEELKKWILKEIEKNQLFILVTHQVNITALLKVFPEEAELFFVKVNSDKTSNKDQIFTITKTISAD